MWPFSRPQPKLTIGTYAYGFPVFPQRLELGPKDIATHKHVLGVSGTGKSKLLESIFLQLFHQNIGVSFIDPHSDSVNAILATLASQGYFKQHNAFDRLLYIEFREDDWFIPFNVLKQTALPHTAASNVKEALHRAWPALSGGAAPMFDTLIQDGVKVLISNALPITSLYRLLTVSPFRDDLLRNEEDLDIVAFFHDQYDRLRQNDQADQAGAALRRAHLLTFNPVLKYSLGQVDNALDFVDIIDSGTSVLFNLGTVQDQEARRLLGCLISIGYEYAALSREGTRRPRTQHHLILDEMGDFVAQSEQALSRMLSQTRKYELFAILAHQTWSQATARLRGSLQNAQVEIAFGIGREDAEDVARILGHVDAQAIKSEARSLSGQPVFKELPAQWEEWIQHLADLPPRNALVKVKGRPTIQIVTPTMPTPSADAASIERIKGRYRQRLARQKVDITLPHLLNKEAPVISRTEPVR